MTKTLAKTLSPQYAKALGKLPEKWLACRDMRHAWAILNNFHVPESQQEGGRKKVVIIFRDLVCMRCETVRHEEYHPLKSGFLDKVYQAYVYPEGYQIPGVPRGANPQSVVQAEQYRRAMQEVAGAAAGETERGE